MSISLQYKKKIHSLKKEFEFLKQGKESLLDIIFETELPESVYNSNAIENSTLTISETERILLEMEIGRDVSVREIFEAKNLARLFEYLKIRINGRNLTRILSCCCTKCFCPILMTGSPDDSGRKAST